MATNTYTYGSLGQRWTIGEPTSKALLDLSRTKADANRWTLQQLVTDPDNTANFALSAATGTFSGDVTLSKDAPYLILTDSGTGGGTSKIVVDAIGSNYGFYFQADGSTNHVILE